MVNKKTLALLGILALGASLSGCMGKTVQTGNVGVFIRQFGDQAGVDPTPVQQGWRMTGIGEDIQEYPVIQRAYPYTREPSKKAGGSDTNEEISFSDHTGLPMTADVQITLGVNPALAPKLYKTWKLDFTDLLSGPIRNDVRNAIAAQTELVSVDNLYQGGREAVIQKALLSIQSKWEKEGVNISSLTWLGSIRYPESILTGITRKSQVEQETLVAQGQVAKAKAEAEARIETAKGLAEATRLEAEALKANPEILRQKEISKWNGLCPLNARVCIVGQGAAALIPADDGK